MRIDPEQHFSCSQCARCCHHFDVVVSEAEVETYRRHGIVDAFEPIPDMPTLQRIRKRSGGACVFLSDDRRCQIHEQLGGARKPLTCRMFPYAFHAAAEDVVMTASFSCPTIIANEGVAIASPQSRAALELLRKERFSASPTPPAPALELVRGRRIDARSARVLRENLLRILKRDSPDIRDNIAAIATVLEDLTRPKVLALADAGFAEYVALTLPYAAAKKDLPSRVRAGRIAALLQYGFVFMVAATRAMIERRDLPSMSKRIAIALLLAHFHSLAPAFDRVNVKALKRSALDINAPEIRPIVFHYLRSTLETLGAHRIPLLDELAIAFSYLNAACALAVMNADAAGTVVDRRGFAEALMESSDVAHVGGSQLFDWATRQLASGTGALWTTVSSRLPA